jgi:hypothetical protein
MLKVVYNRRDLPVYYARQWREQDGARPIGDITRVLTAIEPLVYATYMYTYRYCIGNWEPKYSKPRRSKAEPKAAATAIALELFSLYDGYADTWVICLKKAASRRVNKFIVRLICGKVLVD